MNHKLSVFNQIALDIKSNSDNIQFVMLDEQYLIKLCSTKMPFGKYKGRYLPDIPEHYILWLAKKGFKKDPLGNMLATLYEIRLNGLEHLLKPLRK
jgi:uncharacterized protein (DUF3820 family)